MIRHIALFKFRPGYDWAHPEVAEAEELAVRVGEEVPELLHWQAGRNITDRPVAYDYAIVGLVRDEEALRAYLDHPFHQRSVERWREISTWVVADLAETA
ncbi:Dabb family protein [Streptomyces sp. NPDC101132]|uniref:Dabb family protein n=1 Tax=Streptomyces sp. NPDC101132 TaxID=3366110 RepID=UPI003824E90A